MQRTVQRSFERAKKQVALIACAVAVTSWSIVAAPRQLLAQRAAVGFVQGVAPNAVQQASPLISVKEFQQLRTDPSLVLLHVGPKPDYEAGHIAGARLVTMRDLAAQEGGNALSLELPTETELRERLERLGVSDHSRIVVTFGQDWGSPATRVLWTLQVAGVGANARLLDGGTVAWKRAGLPLTTDVPAAAAIGKLTATPNRALVVDHQWMQAHVNAPKVRIVDGRAPVFFDGPGMKHEGQADMKAGHLPGAVNIPFNSLVDDAVQMLPVDTLRRMFRDAGVQPGDTVAAYCHIGQQGTTVLLAARLLGHPIRLYDGSMNDWERRKLPLVNTKSTK